MYYYYGVGNIAEWCNVGHNDIHWTEIYCRKCRKGEFKVGWNYVKHSITIYIYIYIYIYNVINFTKSMTPSTNL